MHTFFYTEHSFIAHIVKHWLTHSVVIKHCHIMSYSITNSLFTLSSTRWNFPTLVWDSLPPQFKFPSKFKFLFPVKVQTCAVINTLQSTKMLRYQYTSRRRLATTSILKVASPTTAPMHSNIAKIAFFFHFLHFELQIGIPGNFHLCTYSPGPVIESCIQLW